MHRVKIDARERLGAQLQLGRNTTRVFLDNERPTPDGWTKARWPEEVIALLETGQVAEVSLITTSGTMLVALATTSSSGLNRPWHFEGSFPLASLCIQQTRQHGNAWLSGIASIESLAQRNAGTRQS